MKNFSFILVLFCASSTAQAQTPMPDPSGGGGGPYAHLKECTEITNEIGNLTRQGIPTQELAVKAARERWEPFRLAEERAWDAFLSGTTQEESQILYNEWVAAVYAEIPTRDALAMEIIKLQILQQQLRELYLRFYNCGCDVEL